MKDITKKKSYLLIGLATLFISILGATYAYFTAIGNVSGNTIAGNMASVTFDVNVLKKTNVDEAKGGLIPMTNAMIEKAITNDSGKGICVDVNGNAVCQIYKITVNNTGTASMLVDGYVTLTGGSGVPEDYKSSPTTMRWVQAFCQESNDNLSSCTTAGSPTVRQTNQVSWNALSGTGHSTTEIKDSYNSIKTTGTISGNDYDIINTNYIRVSKHTGSTYSKTNDVTSALVYNQLLNANDNNNTNNTGDSNGTYTDSQVYYIAVWLSENGHNQTAGAKDAAINRNNFFQGNVLFITAEGNEVTATFGGAAKVGSQSQTNTKFTGTKYTVNVPDDIDNITTTNPKIVWIDNPIPSGVTQFDTVSAARAAFSNRPFYFKHTIENDIVTESYVEFVVTQEMASANPGMTAGTYTLRGAGGTNCVFNSSTYQTTCDEYSPYYAENVAVLKQAFGDKAVSQGGYCNDFTNSNETIETESCHTLGLGVYVSVSSSGDINVNDSFIDCDLRMDGSSYCSEDDA